MSGGSSSDWWDGWEWRGKWKDSSSPDHTPTEQAPDEQAMYAVHKLQDRLQQMLAMTQRRSHKTGAERTTSVSRGKAAYEAMEAVVMACEWQAEAKRAHDQKFVEAAEAEETYHNAIKRTLTRKDRRTRETRQDSDNEGGLLGGHRSGLFLNTHRASGGDYLGTQHTPWPIVPAPPHAVVNTTFLHTFL